MGFPQLEAESVCRRLKGYRMALLEHGLSIDSELKRTTHLTRQDGIAIAESIKSMDNPPDGLFVASDFCAVTCLGALKQSGFTLDD